VWESRGVLPADHPNIYQSREWKLAESIANARRTTAGEKSEVFDWKARVFDSLSLPALILAPDRTILTVNKPFIHKYGVTKEQVSGKNCYDLFYRSENPCSPDGCPLAEVLANREGKRVLRHLETRDREEKWEDRVLSPILDDEGEVRYVIENMRDVTRVKTLEKELDEVKGLLEKVVQSSTSAIIAADLKGNILLMNPTAQEVTGYTLEEAQEKITIRDIHIPGQAQEIMKKLRDPDLGGKGRMPPCRLKFLNSRGEEIPVEMSAAIIYEDGREVGTMGIFNDIRGNLVQEERMRQMLLKIAQAEKMASLGQLAAGVAHEINNPLTGILLYASLVSEAIDEGNPLIEDIRCVIEDAQRCKDIVKGLLTYSRQTNPNKEVLELNDLVSESLSLIRDQRLFMQVNVVKDLSDELMPIYGNRNYFNQVIINLVVNAIDAMERVGTLTLRTYRSPKDARVCLEVSDTGCGIPKENLSKIFDPFFTSKEPGKGTGLGLSTVYGIVEGSGGLVRVKETSEKGTTFIVELPVHQDSSHTEDA
jgi:PAS domain S-box-containing protein